MAQRDEVIAVVAMADTGALSWRFDPTQIKYQFERLGIDAAKAEMQREFSLAMERAEQTYHNCMNHEPREIDGASVTAN